MKFNDIVTGQGKLHQVGSMIMKSHAPKVICKDGTTLSVQASASHYCIPRNNYGPYTHVEVGFPSAYPPEEWKKYEDHVMPKSGIYGYIPIELVKEYILLHGGEK